jgi:hypothetical protein
VIDDNEVGSQLVLVLAENNEERITNRTKFNKPITSRLVNVIDMKFFRKELKKSQKLIMTHKSNIEKGKTWR